MSDFRFSKLTLGQTSSGPYKIGLKPALAEITLKPQQLKLYVHRLDDFERILAEITLKPQQLKPQFFDELLYRRRLQRLP